MNSLNAHQTLTIRGSIKPTLRVNIVKNNSENPQFKIESNFQNYKVSKKFLTKKNIMNIVIEAN